MKSVVQEASTIGKAIEQGWKAAGEPRDFSIKILEIPQHNFLGFTTRSAKVAIVFDENAPREGAPRERRELREREPRARSNEGRERTPRERAPRTREPRRDSRDRDGRDRDGRDRDSRDRDGRDRDGRGRDRDARDRFGREEGSREGRESTRTDGRGRERRDRRDQRDVQREGRDSYRSMRSSPPESTGDERADLIDDLVLRGGVPPTGTIPGNISKLGPMRELPQRELPQEDIETETPELTEEEDAEPTKQLGQWDAELVASANRWLTETLRLMGLSDVTFTLEPQNFHLRIMLNKPLISDEIKEKHLFASLSTLMMASLKKEFRKALRGHKIVIVHD